MASGASASQDPIVSRFVPDPSHQTPVPDPHSENLLTPASSDNSEKFSSRRHFERPEGTESRPSLSLCAQGPLVECDDDDEQSDDGNGVK